MEQLMTIKDHLNHFDNPALTYSHRSSLLHKNRTYYTGDDQLFWQDDDNQQVSLPYEDILSVEAMFVPTRVQSNRYLFRLKSISKGDVEITNTSYKGLGDFEELDNTFVPFVTKLHAKMIKKNSTITFQKGSSWPVYVFAIFIGIILFVLIIAAFLFFLTSGVYLVAAVKLGILIFFFPRLIRYIKLNKPSSYDPLNLPTDILPNQY